VNRHLATCEPCLKRAEALLSALKSLQSPAGKEAAGSPGATLGLRIDRTCRKKRSTHSDARARTAWFRKDPLEYPFGARLECAERQTVNSSPSVAPGLPAALSRRRLEHFNALRSASARLRHGSHVARLPIHVVAFGFGRSSQPTPRFSSSTVPPSTFRECLSACRSICFFRVHVSLSFRPPTECKTRATLQGRTRITN